jgi:hypothetical protein
MGDRRATFARGYALPPQMPIVFSAADLDSGLIYRSRVDLVDVDADGTSCAYTELPAHRAALLLSTLRLRSAAGRALPEDAPGASDCFASRGRPKGGSSWRRTSRFVCLTDNR